MAAESPARFLPRARLDDLLAALRADDRRVIGPRARDAAVVLDEVASAADLPAGWRSDQAPGSYRARRTDSDRVFDYGTTAASWKAWVYPPRLAQSVGTRAPDGTLTFTAIEEPAPRQAFVGVRPCELAALGVLHRAVDGDPDEPRRRAATLTVAVECAVAGGTCFCTSMGTGPGVESGFDVALTELADGFLVRVGSDDGAALADALDLRPATPAELDARDRQLAATAASMTKGVETAGLPERLRAAAESPHWAEIADRCLACASCTLLCPTCFCTSNEQQADLDATTSVAERRWDSCFTSGFSVVAGGSFRPRVRDRYRQWLTHKFGTWPEQFGTFGCVGCGRCVTWCPAAIDVRDELAAVAPAPPAANPPGPTPAPGAGMERTVALSAPDGEMATMPPDEALLERLVAPDEPAPTRAVIAAPTGPTQATPTDLLPVTWPFADATVIWAAAETHDVTTLRLEVPDPAIRAGRPGQFVMAAQPGFPPSAISISRYHPDGIELTIRAAGPATAALGKLGKGDHLGLRGPLGRPWPVESAEGRDLLVVGGGIGLAPLRPIIDTVQSDLGRFGRMHICYGARTPADRLYVGETMRIRRCRCADVEETVDRGDDDWVGRVGLVTCLFDDASWRWPEVVAFVCGPERMMQVVGKTLVDRGVPPERIWMTMERHMECGVGLCGHCQMGRFFVCRDGPVFSLAELGGVFAVEGI